jgi:hypothetical protein
MRSRPLPLTGRERPTRQGSSDRLYDELRRSTIQNLDDAFYAALDYHEYLQQWKQPPDRAGYWQNWAIGNIREALTPHLSAPNLARRKEQGIRLFPKQEELLAMPTDPRVS